ncbi:MAG: hypothetical protein KDA33_17770 [Phycisphaerales bacterium]|nr:hypothetical protein [Phycisphaerales bacterium]
MTLAKVTPVRGLLLFTIVWIAACYFFEVFSHMIIVGAGFMSAAAAWAIGIYFRRRALKHVEANWKYHLWTSLPLVLFVLTPAVIHFFSTPRSDEPITWASIGWTILPFALKVLVPAIALGWAWWALAPIEETPQLERSPNKEPSA